MNLNGVPKERMVTTLGEIPPGEGRVYAVDEKQIAIFHTRAGRVFATEAFCPHKAGPLADGLVGDTTVICPLHSWKFDLATGAPALGECSIKTFGARLDDQNRIFIAV